LRYSVLALGLAASLLVAVRAEAVRITGHEVSVVVDPTAHELRGQDRLALEGQGELSFLLHDGLEVSRVVGGARPLEFARRGAEGGLALWRAVLPAGVREVVVEYGGEIFEPPRRGASSRHGLATETSGIISPQGLFLPHGAAFHPWQPGAGSSLKVSVETPAGYEAVSVGRMASRRVGGGRTRVAWEAEAEGDSFLIGGPLKLRQDAAGGVPLYLYFYGQDFDLAPAYAARLRELLPFYVGLLGAYPYAKFAVVENFFPTGFGFPSLTLLGQQVVRLPFILEGSLAHELVHSWWGGSVEPVGGNWAEGLTAYLSDYLLIERRGAAEARAERRRMLERYSLYAPRIRAPLAEFKHPGERAGDVLGYTKGALVFHQLRRQLGDEAFFGGLRLAASRFRGAEASWEDLRGCFEKVSGQKLGWFFKQWVAEPGAPSLTLSRGKVERCGQGSEAGFFKTLAVLSQKNPAGLLWRLRVPLALECADGSRLERELVLDGPSARVEFISKAEPRRLVVDPEAHLLRLLGEAEIPASLHRFFAAQSRLYVLPPGPLRAAARQAAETLSATEPGKIVGAEELPEELPEAVMFLGQLPPAFAGRMAGLPAPSGEGFSFQGKIFPAEASALLVSADPKRVGRVLALIYARTPGGLEAAARLLPHLGRYGWAVFEPGRRPVKGEPEAAGWLSLELGAPAGEP
jgi:hypothetical protein